MKGIKIVNRKKETCSTFKLKLEPGTYSITELGKIINSNGKQAIDRKLRSWEVSYSSTGRGAARKYTIEELRNPFKIFCITELGIDVHTDFNKIRDVYYFLLNDPEVPFWPAEKLSALLDSMDRSVSRQSIRKYIEKLIVNNYAGILRFLACLLPRIRLNPLLDSLRVCKVCLWSSKTQGFPFLIASCKILLKVFHLLVFWNYNQSLSVFPLH